MAQTTHKGFARLSRLTAALVWLLIGVGGVVRATDSGLGCADDWPLCQGRLLPPLEITAIIEYSHRSLAALIGVFILLTAIGAWRRHRGVRSIVGAAWLGLVLVIVQSLLGAITVRLELPPEIVVAHLFVALTLIAVQLMVAVAARRPKPTLRQHRPDSLYTLSLVTLPTLLLGMLSGALVTGSGAAAACPTFPTCVGMIFPPGELLLQQIHMLHRILIGVTSILIVAIVVVANRGQHTRTVRAWSWVLAASLVSQIAVGALQAILGLPPALLALHVALAAAVWGSLVVLTTLLALDRRTLAPASTGPDEKQTPRQLGGAVKILNSYIQLTKPLIIGLLLVTTVSVMFIAAQGAPPLGLILATLTGGALAAAGANTINQYLESDIDQLMMRTRRRPIPSGAIRARHALLFGLALSGASFALLATLVNLLSAILAATGIVYYVFIYTLWLKRNTPFNIVVGGAAGAIPPLVGWTAVHNSVSLLPIFLFAIIYYWTPPHTWALTLLVKNDYARASVPMLPVARDEQETYSRIVLYTLLLVALTLMLPPLHMMGLFYLIVASILGAWHIFASVRVWQLQSNVASRRLYKFSTTYLALLFLAMMIDRSLLNGSL